MSTFSSLDMWANHPQSNSAPSPNSKSLLDRQRCLHISCHQYDAWNPSVFRSVIRLYSELGFHTFKGFLWAWQHGTFHNYRTPRCRLQCFFDLNFRKNNKNVFPIKKHHQNIPNSKCQHHCHNAFCTKWQLASSSVSPACAHSVVLYHSCSTTTFAMQTKPNSHPKQGQHIGAQGIYRIWVEDLMKIWSKFLYLYVIVPCPTWTWDVHLSAPQHSSVEIQSENLS